ncbi:hypothetical protein FOTG_12280 [Fusarium oxysporum f. sp. vasinfectum 25433]|uniref:Uncharacterized protein n=1 Tax=Fusarium oxysporum f. sp. vasinfectum 25433 TaxID=1089449 RepID=X0LFQ1_FUSOX|nr:hypothetical protein FOTG_12280 [Fusarium oxysporum f. sp. vasinfectum 25433]
MNPSWEKCATEYDPDPDIAGIGVVTAFITASCLAILSISLYLAIARSGLNIIEAGNVRPPRLGFVESVNPIDDWVRRNVSDPFVKLLVTSRWIRAHINQLKRGLYSFVITLADTQLVTGMAILCTAIIQLRREEISVYHFMTATDLAWLTSGSIREHLLKSLTCSEVKVVMIVDNRRRKYWVEDMTWTVTTQKLRFAWDLSLVQLIQYRLRLAGTLSNGSA